MANKTQREFRKQMKQLEKEGKVPESYYPRRQTRYGYAIPTYILIGLVVLWRFGILHSIYYTVMYRFIAPQEISYDQYETYEDDYNESEQWANDVVTHPLDSTVPADYAKNVTLKAEQYFLENQPIDKSSFEKSQGALELLNSNLPTNLSDLTPYQSKMLQLLEASTAINDFALKHYDKPLTDEEKNNLQEMIRTVKDISFSLDTLSIPQ